MSCDCYLCRDDRRYDAVIERGDVAELHGLIGELREELCNLGFEHSIDNAILNASWPSARDCAERILRLCNARVPQPADRRSLRPVVKGRTT